MVGKGFEMENNKTVKIREKSFAVGCLFVVGIFCSIKYLSWIFNEIDSLNDLGIESSWKSWFTIFEVVAVISICIGMIFLLLPFFTFIIDNKNANRNILILVNTLSLLCVIAFFMLYFCCSNNSDLLTTTTSLLLIENFFTVILCVLLIIDNIMMYLCLSIKDEIQNRKMKEDKNCDE